MTTAVLTKKVSQISIGPACPARTGGEAPTSFCVAHSRRAAGPSDTDLVPSGIEE
jgi:hypothetical protein